MYPVAGRLGLGRARTILVAARRERQRAGRSVLCRTDRPSVRPRTCGLGAARGRPVARTGGPMSKCECCGNEYDKTFNVPMAGKTHVFDSFECAIHMLAPTCE